MGCNFSSYFGNTCHVISIIELQIFLETSRHDKNQTENALSLWPRFHFQEHKYFDFENRCSNALVSE